MDNYLERFGMCFFFFGGGGGVLWDSNLKISPSVSRGESGKFCI